jgi:hypothetical protein
MELSTIHRPPFTALSPLEEFLRDFVTIRGGMWDEIEPQVYDVLLEQDLVQVAFDPEALPEHPQAQLAALGAPLVDQVLSDAASRWNSCACYRIGLHLAPFNLAARVMRTIALSNGAQILLERKRAMYFPQVVFWFKATFTSDQKEEVVLPMGMDLHQLREVRQMESLLAFDRLSAEPDIPLPEAPHHGLFAGYRAARAHVARSVAPLANARRREWSGAIQRQIARMRGYYARLRDEALIASGRTDDPAAVEARIRDRCQSIDREEQLRVAELQRKSELRVDVKLINLLVVYQPKLLLWTSIVPKAGPSVPLQLVWDALSDSIEAATCVHCAQPTFRFHVSRQGLRCPHCSAER